MTPDEARRLAADQAAGRKLGDQTDHLIDRVAAGVATADEIERHRRACLAHYRGGEIYATQRKICQMLRVSVRLQRARVSRVDAVARRHAWRATPRPRARARRSRVQRPSRGASTSDPDRSRRSTLGARP